MKDSDIPAVFNIEKGSFVAPKPEQVFWDDEHKYLVAKEGDKIVGYIGIEDIAGEKHIINMAVHPDFRRQGTGKKLIEKIINQQEVFFLEVRVSNQAAISLYQKYGFQKVGLRKAYYQDNAEDALIMRKDPSE